MERQISMFDTENIQILGCKDCICKTCLYWWSDRCKYGGCYDDLRSKIKPYYKEHPAEPARKGWSNWKSDQAYWCRGGIFYSTHYCVNYIEIDHKKTKCKSCLLSNVLIFQDGYVQCSIIDNIGCDECYKRMG